VSCEMAGISSASMVQKLLDADRYEKCYPVESRTAKLRAAPYWVPDPVEDARFRASLLEEAAEAKAARAKTYAAQMAAEIKEAEEKAVELAEKEEPQPVSPSPTYSQIMTPVGRAFWDMINEECAEM
jgi:hypothetical protein